MSGIDTSEQNSPSPSSSSDADVLSSTELDADGTSKPINIQEILRGNQYLEGVPKQDAHKIKKALEFFNVAGRKMAFPPVVLEQNDQVLRVRVMTPLRDADGNVYYAKPELEQAMKLVGEQGNTASYYRVYSMYYFLGFSFAMVFLCWFLYCASRCIKGWRRKPRQVEEGLDVPMVELPSRRRSLTVRRQSC